MAGPQLVLLGQHGVAEPLVLREVELESEAGVLGRLQLEGDVHQALEDGLVVGLDHGHQHLVICILQDVIPELGYSRRGVVVVGQGDLLQTFRDLVIGLLFILVFLLITWPLNLISGGLVLATKRVILKVDYPAYQIRMNLT